MSTLKEISATGDKEIEPSQGRQVKCCVVVGSHRKNSQSKKVALFCKQFIESEQEKSLDTEKVEIIDFVKRPLPFWDEDLYNEPNAKKFENWHHIKTQLKGASSFIFITPEWGGMVPAALKNFFLFDEGEFLYYRPALLISVSASRNGAYPISELRMSGFKNTHTQLLTEQVIVRNANQVLNDVISVSEEDTFIRERIKYGLQVLKEYAKLLESLRQSGVLRKKDYPYGM